MIKLLLITALLTGCATWEKEVADNVKRLEQRQAMEAQEKIRRETPLTPEQIATRDKARADIATCKYEAAKATGSSQRGYSVYSMLFNDVGDTFREAELIELCLKSKGYGQKT